ncbi:hypothetical protein CAL7716_024850 [Calothrix sp. PCC 7716]|nr:hypothetical protein CAL7716_024850 [Calothrix sp. PCC 7716]
MAHSCGTGIPACATQQSLQLILILILILVKIIVIVDLKLLTEEQLILSKIETIQSQMQEPSTDNTRLEKLHLNNENLLKQYRELVDKIRTNSPQYASIQYPQPLELKQIQQQLDKDSIL